MTYDPHGEKISVLGTPGLLKEGTIEKYNELDHSVEVRLIPNNYIVIKAQIPVGFYSENGLFIGGKPSLGTRVTLSQTAGGTYYINSIIPYAFTSTRITNVEKIPELEDNCIYITDGFYNTIKLVQDGEKSGGIYIGDETNSISLNPLNNIYSNSFGFGFILSESHKEIYGIVNRERNPDYSIPSTFRYNSFDYQKVTSEICFDPQKDPTYANSKSSIRNPSFVEHRQIIYEFAQSFNVLNDEKESLSYKDSKNTQEDLDIDRRKGRADALSLTLEEPNYLIETIKGTVVDIYGNILDLNRNVLTIGESEELSLDNVKTNPDVYKNIRDLHRKSIAYHFDLNARKDITIPPDVTSQENFARLRSRFNFDIDKEGQIKLNVPASSEVGNIPTVTRYENFSTVYPNEESDNPNDLIYNDETIDVLIEQVGSGGIAIKDSAEGAPTSPKDRFTEDGSIHIEHGMVYHDVLSILDSFVNSDYSTSEYFETTTEVKIPQVVSNEIYTAGKSANAGGRSGNLNFDGSLEWNIGANTVDRQSLWLNTQGGIVWRVGRDKNDVSLAQHFDGDVFIEIGGETNNEDTRFESLDNSYKSGSFAIHVLNNNKKEMTTFRIDDGGVTISTPGRIKISANQAIEMKSPSISLESDLLELNGRYVNYSDTHGDI